VADQTKAPTVAESPASTDEAEIAIKPWPDDLTDEQIRASREKGDWYLHGLAEVVTGRDTEIGITLFVHGTIVSGQLVSGHRFFDGYIEGMDDPEVRKAFATPGEVYIARRRALDEDPETPHPAPAYIHLRNARIFAPGQAPLPTNRGGWWRGQIESVDAWVLGTLGEPA
jgi:hypothetical protein